METIQEVNQQLQKMHPWSRSFILQSEKAELEAEAEATARKKLNYVRVSHLQAVSSKF